MTMTLEELRADLATWQPRRTQDLAAIDDAIRERDELRKIERIARCEMIPDVVSWRERAEKAEAKLAALKKRIADSHRALIAVAHGSVVSAARLPGAAAMPGELNGRIVRLLVEDDNES